MLIKRGRSQRSIYREWVAHQKKSDPTFMSRRDLLRKGAVGYTSLFLASTLGGLLRPTEAQAAVNFNKLVTLDMSGGAGFGPEVVFVDRNQNFLPSYSTLGNPLNPMTAGTVSNKYGAYLWTSGLLFQAIEANGSAALKAALKIAVLMQPNNSDDSNNNPTLATHQTADLASKMGAAMRIKSGLAMGSNSTSGGNSQTAVEIPGFKPASGSSLKNVQALLTPSSGALTNLSTAMLTGLMDLSGALTASSRSRLARANQGDTVTDTFSKGIADNRAAVTNTQVFDPRADTAIAGAFGITTATAATDAQVTLASNVKAVTDGLSPHLVAKLGGYDYHDGSNGWKTNQHPKMIAMTVQILNAFAAKGQSVILHWNTDGGIKFGKDTDTADGDFNDAHSAIMFVLSMNGAPQLQRYYLGSFTAGQAAESKPALNLLAANPSHEGNAIFANVLGLNGVTDMTPYTPSTMSSTEFKSLNLFGPG